MNIISLFKNAAGAASGNQPGVDRDRSVCPRTERNLGKCANLIILGTSVIIGIVAVSTQLPKLFIKPVNEKPCTKMYRRDR